jgi:hypothetical protein
MACNRRTALGLLGLPALLLLGSAGPAWAQTPPVPAEVAAALTEARSQGEGRLRFFGLRVYDARLWSSATRVSAGNRETTPFALELVYARKLVGKLIAERSLKEMRRQRDITEAEATRWLSAMETLFPDVKEGDRLTGIHVPGMGVRFAFNGQALGDVREPEFARLFFGIWLSEKSSEPDLRAALLGTP